MAKLIKAKELQERDILLNGEGIPAFLWSDGTPKRILSIEHVVKITFDDWSKAVFAAEHELDVKGRD